MRASDLTKTTLPLILFLLAVATAAAQQMSFSLDPGAPVSTDEVRLGVSQDFPNPCYTSTSSFTRAGNTINVEIVSEDSGGICPQVITPQSVTVNFGQLEAGTYEVIVTWIGAPAWGSRAGSFSFEVGDAPPVLEIVSMNPVGIRFESAMNASYQIRCSPDLDSWSDLGEVITGTGSEIVVYGSGTPDPQMFYCVQVVGSP